MTLFQAIVQAVTSAFSQFAPVGEKLHHKLPHLILGWPEPPTAVIAAVLIGAATACFLFTWNDWASMISSLLQVILFRRRPRTLDERLPLLIGLASLASLPWLAPLRDQLPEWAFSGWANCAGLALGAIGLIVSGQFSRKKKAIYDWNWIDSLLAGASQLGAILPGFGRVIGVLIVAQFRHHQVESALKFAVYLALPALIFDAVIAGRDVTWGAPESDYSGTSWLIFGCALALSTLTSALTLRALTKQTRIEGFDFWVRYRFVGAAALIAWETYRTFA